MEWPQIGSVEKKSSTMALFGPIPCSYRSCASFVAASGSPPISAATALRPAANSSRCSRVTVRPAAFGPVRLWPHYACLRGLPPLAPFARAAADLAGDVACPARRAM